jgi:hypothetical protein
MSKISELSDGGVIQGGDTLIAVRSGGNVKVTYGGTTTANIDGGTIDGTTIGGTTPAAGSFTTGSFTGDVSFGDNDKAIFGAGSDLKIYHDGSDSYIDDTGTGRLRLRGAADIILAHPTNGEIYATFSANGANTFYYDNAAKLATTSTGIDVTGTVTADSVGIGAAGLYFNDGGTKDLIPYSLTANDTVDNSISLGISSKRFKDLHLSGTAYSNNLLVGTTDDVVWNNSANSSADNGHNLRDDGRAGFAYYNATANANATVNVNRTGSDGDLIRLFKSGATVGSIGTFNSVPYFAGQNANAGGFRIDSTGSNGVIIPTTNTGANRDAATDLGYSSGGTNIRFRDLYLSNSVVVTTATNGTSLLDLGDTADSDIGRIAYDNSVDAMYFQTNNSERMRIDSSGNLLVGDTSVIRASSQNGVSVEPEGRIYMSRGTGTGGFSHLQFYNGNGAVGSVVTSGSSTSYNTSSDYRLKENVVPLTGATERVKQLNPSRFNFIVDADTTVDGFLAHEVADVVPEAITGTKDAMRDEEYEVTPAVYEDVVIPAVLDEEGNEVEAERTEQQLVTEAVMGTRSVPDYQGIDQSKLVPLLVATIQELEARIAALESN